jgi:hypothetical protein
VPTAFRVRRRRLLVVGLGAALLVPLSMGPAGAQTPATASGSAAPAAGTAVVGKLVRAVADPRMSAVRKDAPRTKPLAWIEPAHGPAVRVPSDQVAHLPLGATVKVTLGATVTDASPGPSTQEPARQVLAASVVSPATAVAVTPTPDEVTVVKVHPRNSDGSADTTPDSTTMTDLLADLNGPVATYWRNESQGAVELHATAAADGDTWYTPDPTATTATCANAEALWANVATHVGFTPGANKHLFLYLPSMPDNPTALPDCEYGLGTVGSSLHAGGYAYVRDTLTSVMAHELGHNFGLGHSSEYQCDRSVVNGDCGFADYYDLYDVMGASFEQVGSLSAPQANLIGVLPTDQVADLSGHTPGTSTVTLNPMGVHTGKRAIKLGASDGLTYWLEYRSAVGQDSWLGDSTLNTPHLDQGVVIRAEASGLEDASYGDTSLLLDATPSPQTGWEADDQEALKAGRSVYLSSLDYYVTVKSATPGPNGTAVVRVQAGDGALPRDLDRNYETDLLTIDPSGVLYRYDSNSTDGGFAGRVVMGRGWQARDLVTMVGDWDGTGMAQDVVGRDSSGNLWLYTGAGRSAGFTSSRIIGKGWSGISGLLSPGDWNGDGNNDLIARRRSDNTLWLYPGNGTGGFGTASQIGAGWGGMSSFEATGDFDLNGTVDFIARRTDGAMLLYRGNGHGGFDGAGQVIGSGWNIFTSITGVGDWDSDGVPDLLARKSDGTMWFYAGTGDGHFVAGTKVGTGWGSFRMAV